MSTILADLGCLRQYYAENISTGFVSVFANTAFANGYGVSVYPPVNFADTSTRPDMAEIHVFLYDREGMPHLLLPGDPLAVYNRMGPVTPFVLAGILQYIASR